MKISKILFKLFCVSILFQLGASLGKPQPPHLTCNLPKTTEDNYADYLYPLRTNSNVTVGYCCKCPGSATPLTLCDYKNQNLTSECPVVVADSNHDADSAVNNQESEVTKSSGLSLLEKRLIGAVITLVIGLILLFCCCRKKINCVKDKKSSADIELGQRNGADVNRHSNITTPTAATTSNNSNSSVYSMASEQNRVDEQTPLVSNGDQENLNTIHIPNGNTLSHVSATKTSTTSTASNNKSNSDQKNQSTSNDNALDFLNNETASINTSAPSSVAKQIGGFHRDQGNQKQTLDNNDDTGAPSSSSAVLPQNVSENRRESNSFKKPFNRCYSAIKAFVDEDGKKIDGEKTSTDSFSESTSIVKDEADGFDVNREADLVPPRNPESEDRTALEEQPLERARDQENNAEIIIQVAYNPTQT